MQTDPWARKLLLDALSGGAFHVWHDLDDAQYDPPMRKQTRETRTVVTTRIVCNDCGRDFGPVPADEREASRLRVAAGQHWIAAHLGEDVQPSVRAEAS